jgi:hypothetical protein
MIDTLPWDFADGVQFDDKVGDYGSLWETDDAIIGFVIEVLLERFEELFGVLLLVVFVGGYGVPAAGGALDEFDDFFVEDEGFGCIEGAL